MVVIKNPKARVTLVQLLIYPIKNFIIECFICKFDTSTCIGRSAYSAHFGVGSGPIFLDDVQCTSSSSQLLECPSRPILSHNCHHSEDAGVGCEGMFYTENLSYSGGLR